MILGLLVSGGLAITTALGLVATRRVVHFKGEPVADAIDSLLPQTQCGKCGYNGCRPYAQAIATDKAPINRCPPGGTETIIALADLLGRPVIELDRSCGEEKPLELAVIDENLCIGCKKCILACPVDAIVGAPKLMHTVISAQCTGCELCLAPCPVDCIDMVALHTGMEADRLPPPKREPRPANTHAYQADNS